METKQQEHPEWCKENSLTSPSDRDKTNKWKPDLSSKTLSEEEVTAACDELNNTSFVEKFPRIDRTYADPQIPLQTIGLISFVPAKGATPNENGVFGFAKLRGNFATQLEANQKAEQLIRNIDSYHQIYHTYVGRPFPITFSSKFSAETDEIDIRKQTTKTISESIKEKKDEEQRTIKEIKEREQALLDDTSKEPDPYDQYITLRVKLAQLSWTYLEHQKKLEEVKEVIIRTRKEVAQADEEHPTFKDTYYDKYMEARKKAGIVESKEESQSNFIKFLVEDAELPF